MSSHPPQHVPQPAQVVEAADTGTPNTEPPPGEQTGQVAGLPGGSQSADQSQEDERRAHMMAAGLTAMAGVRILAREEQAALEESDPEGRQETQAQWSPQPGLLAKSFAWCILIFFGLGSIVLVSAFIYAMFRG